MDMKYNHVYYCAQHNLEIQERERAAYNAKQATKKSHHVASVVLHYPATTLRQDGVCREVTAFRPEAMRVQVSGEEGQRSNRAECECSIRTVSHITVKRRLHSKAA